MAQMKPLDLDLDVYQGPFDLLFTLILKEEVDICEVPLVEVILAYLEHAVRADEVDWEGLTEFLVLIAALLELKSRVLLPSFEAPVQELDPEAARELLLERLLTYRKFKSAAAALEARLDDQYGRVTRPPGRDRVGVRTPLSAIAGTGKPSKLKEQLERLLARHQGPDLTHISRIRVELPRQVALLRRILRERGTFSFDELFDKEEPLVQAVSLLAVIELMHQGEVLVEQASVFSDIRIAAREVRRIA
ncbi:MAG: segregation/condensation protein A [Thermoleophilia bacterium]